MVKRITKSIIKQHVNSSRELTVYDTEVRGFGVRFRPGSNPSYVFRYSLGRTKKRLHIGMASELEPESAREIAKQFRQSLARGDDPSASKNERKALPTLKQLSERYMREHAQTQKKAGSAKNDRFLWKNQILPLIGHVRVDLIDEEHILLIKTKHSAKPATANRALALLSKSLNLAETWKYRPRKSNPCYLVKKYPEKARERILTFEELDRFNEALMTLRYREAAVLFQVLLMTGARLREIMDAQSAWLDRERKVLRLPDSKTGAVTIRIPTAAIEAVDSLDKPSKCKWLIADSDGKKIKNPYHAWRELKAKAGLEGLRIHDLRHTFASHSHRHGANQRTVAELLNHKVLATAARYITGFEDEVSKFAEKTADNFKPKVSASSSPQEKEA